MLFRSGSAIAKSISIFFIGGMFSDLLNLNAAKATMAFDVERLGAFDGLGVAVTLDACERRLDNGLDTDILVDTYLHATEAAVDVDYSSIEDVGVAQVEGCETEACLHISTLKMLAGKLVMLLAKTDVDLANLTTVLVDLLQLFDGVAVVLGAATILVTKNQRETPYHRYQTDDVFPNIVPRDDVACGQ